MRSTKNETRERTEVRVFIATALPTKAVCWTVVAANIFVYICVCFCCAVNSALIITSRLREKNYAKREEDEGFGVKPMRKKEKKRSTAIHTLNPGVNPKP